MVVRLKIVLSGVFLLLLFVTIADTAGAEFKLGSADVSFNSQLLTGSSRRLNEANLSLVTSENRMGLGSASSSTSDDGNLNFEEGDIYPLNIKDLHDLEISKNDFGSFLRVQYWRDQELENGKRPYDNANAANCALDGCLTDTSWGYRIRAALTCNSAFAGINPVSIFWKSVRA